ncbi:MAG: T9SS C-terminal target domain-containing protein [Candidatus Kapaibacterium sp.]|nr:MAG: T9SS C-terminal target domain-containing protein [Candidatus Kapabacteria bacterium]
MQQPSVGTGVAVQEEHRLGNSLNSDAARIIPNPAINYATLHYSLTEANFVRVELFSLLGQRMNTIFEGKQLAGEHTLSLPLQNIPRGVYVCRLWVGETSKSLRLIVGD